MHKSKSKHVRKRVRELKEKFLTKDKLKRKREKV